MEAILTHLEVQHINPFEVRSNINMKNVPNLVAKSNKTTKHFLRQLMIIYIRFLSFEIVLKSFEIAVFHVYI